MKIRSLFYSAIFVASLALTTIFFLFLYFLNSDYDKHLDTMFNRYQIIRSIMLNGKDNMSHVDFDSYLRQFNMYMVFHAPTKSATINNAKLLTHDRRRLVTETLLPATEPFILRKEIELDLSLLEYEKKIYFYLRTPLGDALICDETLEPYIYSPRIYTLFVIILVLTLSFVYMLFKLYPIRKISQTLKKFGDGDLEVRLALHGNDELAEISDTFNQAAQKIRSLIEGRTLFMRNVMHELKTPIAKGRILSQMAPSRQHQERFDQLFIHMQKLIDDFALLDQVKSEVNIHINESYYIRDLVDEAVELSLHESEQVTIIEKSYEKIDVDYHLFVIVLKNLIDNGIKYSHDGHVIVEITNRFIVVRSQGIALKESLNYYLEAFTGEKKKESFGLGLYIVDSILKLHKMKLTYKAHNGYNDFIIEHKKTA